MQKKIWASILVIQFFASAFIFIAPGAVSDPVFNQDSDGVASVKWDFNNTSHYMVTNASLEPGYANLSLYESVWSKRSLQDFLNGTSTDLNISGNGNVSLSITGKSEILGNGNFTDPGLLPGEAPGR